MGPRGATKYVLSLPKPNITRRGLKKCPNQREKCSNDFQRYEQIIIKKRIIIIAEDPWNHAALFTTKEYASNSL